MNTALNHPIFEPFQLSTLALKNRILVAPMTQINAKENGVPTKSMLNYYAEYARGGFAAIITEGVYPDDMASRSYNFQPGIVNDEQTKGWADIVQAVKKHNCAIICQLMHGGALSQFLKTTIAPSGVRPLGVKMPGYGGEGEFPLPKAMTLDDVRRVVQEHAEAAQRAVKAGFDGVEIHGANGYLIDQFLTDYTNVRDDQYGGSIENQVRIIHEIISEIRKAVPKDFMIGLRLSEAKVNNLSYRWPEGSARARILLKEVKKSSPDYIHVASEGGPWHKACIYSDGSSFPGLAKEIVRVPVIANGGLHDLQLSRKVLEDNHGDLISIGKAALSDPHWPLKTLNGKRPKEFVPYMTH